MKECEDGVTSILVSLLKIRYVRTAIFNAILDKCEYTEQIAFENIYRNTQIENGDRPDIQIRDKNVCIFIENKIYKHTDLQKSQITSYPKQIYNTNTKYMRLIFLIPKRYIHESEIRSIMKQYDFVSVVYWEDLLAAIKFSDICYGNALISESVQYIEDCIFAATVNTEITVKEVIEMINTKGIVNTISVLAKIRNIIAEAEPLILEKLGNDYSASDWQMEIGDIDLGKYLHYKNKEFAFYGVNTSIITEDGTRNKYLFSFAISKEAIPDDKLNRNGFEYIDDNDWYYIPLDIGILGESNQVKAFSDSICDIIVKIQEK